MTQSGDPYDNALAERINRIIKEEFLEKLKTVTEAACDEFLIEAATGVNPPPLPESARRRLNELGVTLS